MTAIPVGLPATLSIRDAPRERWEVAIVGAGPAGGLAAGLLARTGRHVLLIERAALPRDKVCGCCLNAAALGTLAACGLGDLVPSFSAPVLTRLHLSAGGRDAVLPLPRGAALSRRALDTALAARAMADGAEFLPRTSAWIDPPASPREGLSGQEAFRSVMLRQGEQTVTVRARVVLACDGLAGRLLAAAVGSPRRIARASYLGAAAWLEEPPAWFRAGCVHMAVGRGGYLGCTILEDGRLDVGMALSPGACRAANGPGMLARHILQEAGGIDLPALAATVWRGTPALTCHRPLLGAWRLLSAGDACGYVEPFTGEGIAWALASARAVVGFALSGQEVWPADLARQWTAAHHRLLAQRRRRCSAVAHLLRHPWLLAALLPALARVPGVVSPLIRAINRPIGPGLPQESAT